MSTRHAPAQIGDLPPTDTGLSLVQSGDGRLLSEDPQFAAKVAEEILAKVQLVPTNIKKPVANTAR